MESYRMAWYLGLFLSCLKRLGGNDETTKKYIAEFEKEWDNG